MQSKAGINVSTDYSIELSETIHFFAQMDGEELKKWSESAFTYSEQAVDFEETRRAYIDMFEGAK